MAEKTYCGIGKLRTTKTREGQEFTTLGVSFSPEHLQILNDWASNNKGWASININERKSPSDKGVTHNITLNTYKPDSQDTPSQGTPERDINDELNSIAEETTPF